MADPLQDLAKLQQQLVDSEQEAEALLQAMAKVGEQIHETTNPAEVKALNTALEQLNAQFKTLESASLDNLVKQQKALTAAMVDAAKNGKPTEALAASHAALNAPIAGVRAEQKKEGPLAQVRAQLNQARSPVAKIGSALAKGASAVTGAPAAGADYLSGVATAAQAAEKSLLSLPDTIGGLAGPFAQLVQQFDPALLTQFQQALGDLSAALGSIVAPVIEAFRSIADMVNSVVSEIMPVLRPVIDQLMSVFKDLVGTLLADLQPVLRIVADIFSQVVAQLRPVLDALLPVFAQLGPLIGNIIQAAFVPLQAILGVLVPVIQAVAPVLATLGAVINEFFGIFRELGATLMEFIGPILKPIMDGIKSVFGGLMNTVRDVVAAFGATIATLQYMARTIAEAGAWSTARLTGAFNEAYQRMRNAGSRNTEVRRPTGGHTFAAGNATNIDTAAIGQQARLAALAVRSETAANTEATNRNSNALEDVARELRGAAQNAQNLPGQAGQAANDVWQGTGLPDFFRNMGIGGSN